MGLKYSALSVPPSMPMDSNLIGALVAAAVLLVIVLIYFFAPSSFTGGAMKWLLGAGAAAAVGAGGYFGYQWQRGGKDPDDAPFSESPRQQVPPTFGDDDSEIRRGVLGDPFGGGLPMPGTSLANRLWAEGQDLTGLHEAARKLYKMDSSERYGDPEYHRWVNSVKQAAADEPGWTANPDFPVPTGTQLRQCQYHYGKRRCQEFGSPKLVDGRVCIVCQNHHRLLTGS